MKGNYTIIFSAVIILILLGILAYLNFFMEKPADESGPNDVFSNLEFDALGENADTLVVDSNTGLPDISGTQPRVRLRQLTTRNTIGYAEVVRSTTTPPVVLIGEAGVGHIYEINLEQGTETRIGYTTIPDARSMVFSNDGATFAVITSERGGAGQLKLGVLSNDGSAALTVVADNVIAATILDGVLLYGKQHNNGVDVVERNLARGSEKTLFTVPFREAVVVFGETAVGPHIAYPKSSQHLEGFIYSYTGTTRTRTPLSGFGLTAGLAGDTIIGSWRNGSELNSYYYEESSRLEMASPVIPEKCTGVTGIIVCGHSSDTTLNSRSTDAWHQGTTRFEDDIWLMSQGQLRQLIDIEAESGRTVDLISPTIGYATDDLYFKNKLDQTLWWYDLSEDIIATSNQ